MKPRSDYVALHVLAHSLREMSRELVAIAFVLGRYHSLVCICVGKTRRHLRLLLWLYERWISWGGNWIKQLAQCNPSPATRDFSKSGNLLMWSCIEDTSFFTLYHRLHACHIQWQVNTFHLPSSHSLLSISFLHFYEQWTLSTVVWQSLARRETCIVWWLMSTRNEITCIKVCFYPVDHLFIHIVTSEVIANSGGWHVRRLYSWVVFAVSIVSLLVNIKQPTEIYCVLALYCQVLLQFYSQVKS